MLDSIETLIAEVTANLPLQMTYTAPSGKQSPFTVLTIEFDPTSYDNSGDLGVFWCAGILTFESGATMTFCPTAQTLSPVQ